MEGIQRRLCCGVNSLTIRSGGQKVPQQTAGKCSAERLILNEDLSRENFKLDFSTNIFGIYIFNFKRMYDCTSLLVVSGANRETNTIFFGFTAARGFALCTMYAGKLAVAILFFSCFSCIYWKRNI